MKTLRDLEKFLNSLENTRLSKEKLGKDIEEFLGYYIPIEKLTQQGLDNRVGFNLILEDRDLYIDIYYLKDYEDNMFITEISIDSDQWLSKEDYDKELVYSTEKEYVVSVEIKWDSVVLSESVEHAIENVKSIFEEQHNLTLKDSEIVSVELNNVLKGDK